MNSVTKQRQPIHQPVQQLMQLRRQALQPASRPLLRVRSAAMSAVGVMVAALLLSSVMVTTVRADENVQAPVTSQADVGEVSLVLGRAYRERGADRERLAAGDAVRVGDTVYTEAGGHVHVRFVDDALVSVRPSSTLEIVRYDYDASRPEHSAVKFELSEGVARAISGDAAKSARERFRMNTPIAAIGVRGTDFVVSANSGSMRALVNEGSIVVAPYSSECSSEALGPCALDAVELTQNTLQAVEVDQAARAPRLVASVSNRSAAAVRLPNADPATTPAPSEAAVASTEAPASSAAATSSDSTEVYLESVANEQVTTVAANTQPAPVVPETTPVVPEPEPLIDFTPTVALTAADTASSQLVWGRWSDSTATDNLFAIDLETAREGRKVTISGDGALLYRSEPTGARVDRDLTLVKFDLASAQAFYDAGTGVVAMRVGGGDLELDFVERAFATSLLLDHAATGEINFRANGTIADGGYFRMKTDTQRVTGAVATDGSEASYYFEQQLESGSVNGFTLWGAQ